LEETGGITVLTGYHETYFKPDPRRELIWKTLCVEYFQPLIKPDDCVLELGTGYGHFINNIICYQRIALDSWKGAARYLAPEVVYHIGNVTDLSFLANDSVDFIFASNLFEHLTHNDFTIALYQIQKKLKHGGTLNILQPNYRFAYRQYFDDYTHISVYSDRSLVQFIESRGFRVIECIPRFLPLTVKCRLPVWPLLIRLYLKLPFKPMGKQMLLRATIRK
jgi:SAM-dependent methyltransferase